MITSTEHQSNIITQVPTMSLTLEFIAKHLQNTGEINGNGNGFTFLRT